MRSSSGRRVRHPATTGPPAVPHRNRRERCLDPHGHQGIHAQFGQRLVRVDGAVFGVAHDYQNASAQTRGDDPVGLGGIHIAKRVGARPVVVVAFDVQFLGEGCEVPELLKPGNAAAPRSRRSRATPTQRSPASTASRASMPSAGATGSESTEGQCASDADVGPPAPIDRGGRQIDARRHATKASSHALAQA